MAGLLVQAATADLACRARRRGRRVLVPQDGQPLDDDEMRAFTGVLRGYGDRQGTAMAARAEREAEARLRGKR
jgi:hypothetical protein